MVRGVEVEAARTIEQQLLAHGDVPFRHNRHRGKRARGIGVHHLDSLAVGLAHRMVDVAQERRLRWVLAVLCKASLTRVSSRSVSGLLVWGSKPAWRTRM